MQTVCKAYGTCMAKRMAPKVNGTIATRNGRRNKCPARHKFAI
jgi:hypothetical protein